MTTHKIAKLPAPPDVLAAARDYVVARIAPQEIVHVDVRTQKLTHVKLDEPIEGIAIDEADDTWILSAGKPYQWKPGTTPIPVDAPGHVTEILPIRGGALLHCATAVVLIRGAERRVIPVSSTGMAHVSTDDIMVFETPHLEVGLLDLATGSTVIFPLKKPIMSMITGDESRVAYRGSITGDEHAVLLWTLRVPRDPVLLRGWLDTITNARPIANSDAVAYP